MAYRQYKMLKKTRPRSLPGGAVAGFAVAGFALFVIVVNLLLSLR